MISSHRGVPEWSTSRSAGPMVLTAWLCLMLVALVACDDNSDASPPPTAGSTSPTPSPTPSRPAPPTLPPAAKALTVESADRFVRYYLQLLDYAKVSHDLTPLRAWSDKGCLGCKELIDGYSRDFAAGGSYAGDFTFKNVVTTGVRLNNARAAEVKFRATVGRHTVTESRGGKPSTYPGETVRWRVALTARDGQWIMYEMEDEAG